MTSPLSREDNTTGRHRRVRLSWWFLASQQTLQQFLAELTVEQLLERQQWERERRSSRPPRNILVLPRQRPTTPTTT